MGNPVMEDAGDGRTDRPQLTTFYGPAAWIEGTAEQQLDHLATLARVTKIAAFPDLHPGKYGPVGCAVLANMVHPQLIGSDIGCGMGLYELDLPLRRLKHDKAADRLRVLEQPDYDRAAELLEAAGIRTDLAPEALGSIGGGNHFCEVQAAREIAVDVPIDGSRVFLLVHSGSRGVGSGILSPLLRDGLVALRPDSAAARHYVARHDEAVIWARLNRQMIAERAAMALRADARLIADVPHNLLTQEIGGWLHRKGAAVAQELVPLAGSRATPSYLMRPQENPDALGSMAHGAGRKFDRASMHKRLHSGRADIKALQRTELGGRVICEDKAMLLEEAPQAYKCAETVAQELEDHMVARRCATLVPLITYKRSRAEPRHG